MNDPRPPNPLLDQILSLRKRTVTIPDDAWQASGLDANDGDERSVLVASIVINDTPMHVTAYEVVPEADPQQFVQYDDDAAALARAFNPDSPWRTTEIGGRHYVIFADPFAE